MIPALILALAAAGAAPADTIPTTAGPLEITLVGHGTLMLEWNGRVVHVDPWSKLADYSTLPDADLILVTHEHRDHLDVEAIAEIRTETTRIVANPAAAEPIPGAVAMANGDRREEVGVGIEAVPAYNLVHLRDSGEPYHPKGQGNGYLLTFADVRVYVAGDTENVPEMDDLENVDVAFLPMNLPYTMTPEMTADAARKVHPRILYPYHYGDTDPQRLVDLLADEPDIEVRVRPAR